MIFHARNIIQSYLLIVFTGITISCSKANNFQMPPSQPIDSVPATTSNNDTIKRTYLALGDSYTIGQSVPVNDRYPMQTIKLLNSGGFHFSDPEIIATSGWTTVNLEAAINTHHFADSIYDIVTLLIGVNDQYQGSTQSEYKNQFTVLLQKSIQFAGNKASHVIVISIPDYSVTPFATNSNKALIGREIDSFNIINRQISAAYEVNYIDITDESRKAATDETLIASDGLHFTGKEYAIWSAMLAAKIKKILQ